MKQSTIRTVPVNNKSIILVTSPQSDGNDNFVDPIIVISIITGTFVVLVLLYIFIYKFCVNRKNVSKQQSNLQKISSKLGQSLSHRTSIRKTLSLSLKYSKGHRSLTSQSATSTNLGTHSSDSLSDSKPKVTLSGPTWSSNTLPRDQVFRRFNSNLRELNKSLSRITPPAFNTRVRMESILEDSYPPSMLTRSGRKSFAAIDLTQQCSKNIEKSNEKSSENSNKSTATIPTIPTATTTNNSGSSKTTNNNNDNDKNSLRVSSDESLLYGTDKIRSLDFDDANLPQPLPTGKQQAGSRKGVVVVEKAVRTSSGTEIKSLINSVFGKVESKEQSSTTTTTIPKVSENIKGGGGGSKSCLDTLDIYVTKV